MKITEALLAEHVVFHNLFDHLEKTVPRLKTLEEVKLAGTLLETLMRAHSETEDELFIDPLESYLAQIGQNETFHEEHEAIDRELKEMQKARTLESARKLLLTVVESSRQHFDKEERIVFPMAEKVFKPKTLLELGDSWKRWREAKLK
ncbi:MAG TPA: hemerythrin domain-containing protein [Candidatus Acidoferrum sp.]|nr:hemerythrin domain-containing protein [Candidatus Acidoferrum sp.]